MAPPLDAVDWAKGQVPPKLANENLFFGILELRLRKEALLAQLGYLEHLLTAIFCPVYWEAVANKSNAERGEGTRAEDGMC